MMSCGDMLALERTSELVTPLDLAQTIIVSAKTATAATAKPRYLRIHASISADHERRAASEGEATKVCAKLL